MKKMNYRDVIEPIAIEWLDWETRYGVMDPGRVIDPTTVTVAPPPPPPPPPPDQPVKTKAVAALRGTRPTPYTIARSRAEAVTYAKRGGRMSPPPGRCASTTDGKHDWRSNGPTRMHCHVCGLYSLLRHLKPDEVISNKHRLNVVEPVIPPTQSCSDGGPHPRWYRHGYPNGKQRGKCVSCGLSVEVRDVPAQTAKKVR